MRLFAYTTRVAANLQWRGVRGVNFTNGELAQGISCEDLVGKVILSTFAGTRHWDPDKGELEYWLRQQIKSEISHLVLSAAHKRERDELAEERDTVSGTEEPIFPTTFYSLDPAAIILGKEEMRDSISVIYAAADKDPQIEALIFAILEGCEPKPRHLAQELGTTVEDINNRLRALRRHVIRDRLSQENES